MPEGKRFFARSPPALWNAELIPLGSPDRAKGIYLCALCVSVVNHFCVYQDTPVNAYLARQIGATVVTVNISDKILISA